MGKSCWGWGGTTSAYSYWKGNQSFDYEDFQTSFKTEYSQISGVGVSSGFDVVQSHVGYSTDPTSAGHQRAMAFCLSKAVPVDTHNLANDCYGNLGSAIVIIKRNLYCRDELVVAWRSKWIPPMNSAG